MSYQISVDWAWNSGEACGRPVCLFFKVWDDPLILRGPLSAHVCVEAAIVARSHNIDLAARWLMAAQAHNVGAQNEIWDNKQAAVDYAHERYGHHGVAMGGDPMDRTTIIAGDGNGGANMDNFITPPETIWQHARGIFKEDRQRITADDLFEAQS